MNRGASGRSDSRPPRVAEVGRGLLGAAYLMGGGVHLFLWWQDPGVYAAITSEVLFGRYRELWTGFVLPNLDLLLPALAAFEFVLAGLLFSRGRAVRAGNGVGIAFQVVLAPLGSWWPTNLSLAFGHALLARYDFDEDARSALGRRLGARSVPEARTTSRRADEP